MKTLIIYAHPYDKSFNSKILRTLLEVKKDAEVIDLYADKFNPVYSKEELKLFERGETTDALVSAYQDKISSCSELIFIFPIWWNDMPGIVKGFLDVVMKKSFAYEDSAKGVVGKLHFINSVKVITTSNSPTWYIKFFAGNSIKSSFLNATCKQLGIKRREWVNLGNIKNTSTTARNEFLKKIIA